MGQLALDQSAKRQGRRIPLELWHLVLLHRDAILAEAQLTHIDLVAATLHAEVDLRVSTGS